MSVPLSELGGALLIVASSGRALAASAARVGMPVVVLDLYDDLDTRRVARASRAVAGRNGRFNSRLLLTAAAELCPPRDCAGLVYGSGLEGRVGLLKQLARDRTLFGNDPETVAIIKDPARFFPLLDKLGVAHPAVRLEPPRYPAGWLVKRTGAAGGSHVRQATTRHRAAARRYFQRFAAGPVGSVLFAADGKQARVIGLNEQWTAGVPWCAPYCYGGAVTCVDLSAALRAMVAEILDRIVASTGLKGVNGLDFIVDGDVPSVLEINPRPTATLDLYDADLEAGIVGVHMQACQGKLPEPLRLTRARAHAIVYASRAFRAPTGEGWPAWCTDLPRVGSFIPRGAPVCSVHADADTVTQARQLIESRREQMQGSLWSSAA